MSSNVEQQAVEEVCASCGITGGDDVKLRLCTACKLVKYCGVDCQKNHRPQHKKQCKKRAAEIRDDKLFKQPDESHLGECSLCCLPLPIDIKKWTIYTCCSQRICDGCAHANKQREIKQGLEQRCPYCREELPENEEEINQNKRKRAKANDPLVLLQMGMKCDREGDIEGAIQYYSKAATLGNMPAHFNLSVMYKLGEGVEKDMKKYLHHMEEAAIGGHPTARYNLGCVEYEKGRIDRAVKHFIIAANLGDDRALEAVKNGFAGGVMSKEDYEVALRGHQAAVDATKSTQREEAEKAKREGSYHTL
jgi:tetratricopeptide (TPR) repeat protein